MTEERTPPHSDEAERGALGALMLDSLRVLPIAQRMGIRPESFYVPAHRLVCEAIYGAAVEKTFADVLVVAEWLTRKKRLAQAGGSAALEKMIDDTPTAAHGEYYLDIVRQKQMLREIVALNGQTTQECYEAERGDGVAARAADGMMRIVEHNVPQEESKEEIMAGSIRRWRDAKDGKAPAIGLRLPWPGLTELLCGLEPGLTILAGRPSMGKTMLEGCIAVDLASQGIPVARITLDHTEQDLLERGICRKAGVSLPKLKFGYAGEAQMERVTEAKEALQNYPMWINDRDRDIRVVCAWARMMVARYGIKLLTLDFIQLLLAAEMGSYQWNDVARVTFVSGQLKGLAIELGIPVLALSQLSRVGEREKKKRLPQLSDLRESGALEQDASKVAFVYRDEKLVEELEEAQIGATKHKRPTWVDVAKHKNGETGRIPFWMYPHYFRLDETEPGFPMAAKAAETDGEVFPDEERFYES